jgi:Protein of unknown function (DUF3750)
MTLRRAAKWFGIFIVVVVLLPVAVGATRGFARGWPESWRTADWSSSGLLPQAAAIPSAKVYVLAARTGGWKSIFAEHTSIVMKTAGASEWTRYEVVGWGAPVRRNAYAADARWYGNRPYVVAEFDGAEAEALIPRIVTTVGQYPHSRRGSYTVWPGPNSNTFVAWVVRHTEGFAVELPPVAIGKDYLSAGLGVGGAASGTGFFVSVAGIFGVTLALEEGLEINFFGTALGIDPDDLAVKLPALGKLSVLDLMD